MVFDSVWMDLDGSASKDMDVGSVAHGKESRTADDGDRSMGGTAARRFVYADLHRPCRGITRATDFPHSSPTQSPFDVPFPSPRCLCTIRASGSLQY